MSEVKHSLLLAFRWQDWEEKIRSWNGLFYRLLPCPSLKVRETFCVLALAEAGDAPEMAFSAGSGREGRGWSEGWRITTTGLLSRGATRLCPGICVVQDRHRGYRDFCCKLQTQKLEIINLTTLVNCKIMVSCQSVQSGKSCRNSQLHQLKYPWCWWGVFIQMFIQWFKTLASFHLE